MISEEKKHIQNQLHQKLEWNNKNPSILRKAPRVSRRYNVSITLPAVSPLILFNFKVPGSFSLPVWKSGRQDSSVPCFSGWSVHPTCIWHSHTSLPIVTPSPWLRQPTTWSWKRRWCWTRTLSRRWGTRRVRARRSATRRWTPGSDCASSWTQTPSGYFHLYPLDSTTEGPPTICPIHSEGKQVLWFVSIINNVHLFKSSYMEIQRPKHNNVIQ